MLILVNLILLACDKKETNSTAFSHEDLKLWYQQPAENWNEALPLGNGRLGAMIYGGSSQEHIQLNEETFWAGEPGNNVLPKLKELLPELRKMIFEGRHEEAEALAMTALPRHAAENNNYGMPYQTIGDLFLDFKGHGQIEDYYRDLDIGSAVATFSYKTEGVNYHREFFTSLEDDVMVLKLSADQAGAISFSLSADSPQKTFDVNVANNQLVLSGTSGSVDNKVGKVKFKGAVEIKTKNGTLTKGEKSIEISGADEAIVLISLGTNFKNYDELSDEMLNEATKKLEAVRNRSYEDMKQDHIENYQQYFQRVALDLGETEAAQKPTDIRLAEFSQADDPALVSLYFQYGRYLLISSSQPGGQPANLQGIWNNLVSPPWDSKYTININTEMNYWPAEVTNLSEMHEPLFEMIRDLSETGKQSAQKMYDARGWNVHHNTDLWRMTGPIDGAHYGLWPMGGAWLSQHLWQHYLYTGDRSFLEENYEVIKGAAFFYNDVLQEEPETKWQIVVPSMSPENSHQGGTTIAGGTTMDNQLVFDVFSNFVQTAQLLDRDKALASAVQDKINQLAPMQIGHWGQLQEWMHDWDDPSDGHRHVSHLYGLYPSNQISPFQHPQLFEAAKTSLVARGDKSTGWSMGWKVNLWARLLNGNRAYKLIHDQLTPALTEDGEAGGTYPNLLDAHPPFQIDGNFGCTSGIAEMLVQSHDGAVHLLPALPEQWKEGHLSGIKLRGGFELVSMKWQDSKLVELKIKSNLGGNLRLRTESQLDLEMGDLEMASGINPNPFFQLPEIKTPLVHQEAPASNLALPEYQLYDVATEKGKVYLFQNAGG